MIFPLSVTNYTYPWGTTPVIQYCKPAGQVQQMFRGGSLPVTTVVYSLETQKYIHKVGGSKITASTLCHPIEYAA